MIVTKSEVIAKNVADAARESLNSAVARKRVEGALDPGKTTLKILQWTTETTDAAKEFEKSMDFELLKGLGLTTIPNSIKENIKFAGPMVYGDVLDKPVTYAKVAPAYTIIGILALGALQLPEIGNSSPKLISSGSVAYFRGDSSVVYRSCGGGRGILFYVKTDAKH